jgi:hypothetical protein
MKAHPPLLLSALLFTLPAILCAQLPSGKHSLGLDAAVMSSGGSGTAHAGYHQNIPKSPHEATNKDFSQKHTQESGLALDVSVRNFGQQADHAKLEWYFFANPIGKGENFIFDQGSQQVTIAPGSTSKIPVESKELHSAVVKQLHTTNAVNGLGQHIPPSASVHKTGSLADGWIVRLVTDDGIAAVKASSPTLEALGKSDEQLAAFKHQGPGGGAKGGKGGKKK